MKLKRTLFAYTFVLFLVTLLIVNFNSELEAMSANGDNEYLAFAEEMPAPVGGMSAIVKHIKYPMIAEKSKIEGTVYLQAFINESGSVEKVIILKDIGGGCGEAAVEAVKKASFTPGKMKGATVKVKLSLPIAFKLQ